jgi:hypothetical protein
MILFSNQKSFYYFFCFFFFFTIAFFIPQAVSAADYYVNNSQGTDDVSYGTGTGTDAWATLKYALTGSRIAKGDTVYLEAGTWSEDQISVAVGAGNGEAVTVTNYNDDVVTLQTGSAPPNGWIFINSLDMVFDGVNFDNNNVAMSVKFLFGLYSTSTTVNLTVSNASIDGESSTNYIRLFKLYGTQAHNLTLNKIDVTNGGILVEAKCTGSGSNTVTIYSSIIRNGHVLFTPGTGTTPTDLVLKNNLFTRLTGYGFHLNLADTTVEAVNNIFVNGGVGYADKTWNLGLDFGTTLASNSSVLDATYNYYYSEDSPFNVTTYADIISSTRIVPHLPIENWFVNPSFTNIGTDYTLQSSSLIAGRGANDHPTDGTDINGTTYGVNDVGPYVNPARTSLPNTNSGEIGWHGDSVMNGTGASTEDDKPFTVLENSLSGYTVQNYALGGQFSKGLFFAVDQSLWSGRERTLIFSVGINDVITPRFDQTNTQVANKIIRTMEKIEAAGITPVFLGISSISGNPPNNTDVDAIYTLVSSACTSNGWT